MKLLDFAKMKKTGGDENTTHFKDEDGNEMKIMHKALSRLHQEQIKRLPVHKMEFADGGSIDPTDSSSSSSAGDPPPNSSQDAPKSPDHSTTINLNLSGASNPQAVPASLAAPSLPDAAQSAPAPGGQISTQNQPDVSTAPPVGDLSNQTPQGPVHDVNTDTVAALQGNNATSSGANAQVQAVLPKLQDSINEMIKSGVVNPNHYAESQDSDQKTGTAIGLALMGFGGTGAAGLNFINQQIDRDVHAQQQNFENKKNIFGAYKEMFGNTDVAAQMAIAAGANILANKVKIAALQDGRPIAVQNGSNIIQGLNQRANQALSQAAQGVVQKQGQTQAPQIDKNGIYTPDSLLAPGGLKKLQNLRISNPLSAPVEKLQDQYDLEYKADNVLKNLPNQFKTLKNNATEGGWLGRSAGAGAALGAAGEASGLGHIASAIASKGGGVLGDLYTATGGGPGGKDPGSEFEKNRNYESAKSSLYTDILSALHGSNVSGEEIQNIINKNTPDFRDTPANVTQKMKTIEMFIKNAARGSLTGAAGISKE